MSSCRPRWGEERGMWRRYPNHTRSLHDGRRRGDATMKQNRDERAYASRMQCSGRVARCHPPVTSMRDEPEGGTGGRRQGKNRPVPRAGKASGNSPGSRHFRSPSVPVDRGSGAPVVQHFASRRPRLDALMHLRPHVMADLGAKAPVTDQSVALAVRPMWRSTLRNDDRPALEEIDLSGELARTRRRRQLENESAPCFHFDAVWSLDSP